MRSSSHQAVRSIKVCDHIALCVPKTSTKATVIEITKIIIIPSGERSCQERTSVKPYVPPKSSTQLHLTFTPTTTPASTESDSDFIHIPGGERSWQDSVFARPYVPPEIVYPAAPRVPFPDSPDLREESRSARTVIPRIPRARLPASSEIAFLPNEDYEQSQ